MNLSPTTPKQSGRPETTGVTAQETSPWQQIASGLLRRVVLLAALVSLAVGRRLFPEHIGMPPVTLIALTAVGFGVLAMRMRKPGVTWLLYGSFGATVGAAFLLLVGAANALPVTRGSKVIMRHEFVRLSALTTGVVFLVLVLGALLPILLDALERGPFATYVGARHVRAHKSGFLSTIAVLSILGVSVSSCALGSVISLMGGFGADLKRKILANNAHVVVDSPTPQGFLEWEPVLERVRAVPNVVAALPMVTGEVMASVGTNTSGVLLRGVDPQTVGDVIDLPLNVELGHLEWLEQPELVAALPWSARRGVESDEVVFRPSDEPTLSAPAPSTQPVLPATPPSAIPSFMREKHEEVDPEVEKAARPFVAPERPAYPCVIVGRELAKTLHLRLGSELSLVSRMGELTPAGVVPRERKFRVAGIFFSGMYEYDATHAYITLKDAREFLDQPDRLSSIQIKVTDAEQADLVTPLVARAVARPELRIRDWREINKGLFSALKLERIATFIVLSLTIIVASFCILCTLLLMVTEKGQEIAILKALGASDGAILKVFMVEGMIIGGIGTMFGVAVGYATCFGLSWFGLRIDPDVYYIDRLPIAVNGWDFAAVTVAALVICALATLYPARAASKLMPVEGLRYE